VSNFINGKKQKSIEKTVLLCYNKVATQLDIFTNRRGSVFIFDKNTFSIFSFPYGL